VSYLLSFEHRKADRVWRPEFRTFDTQGQAEVGLQLAEEGARQRPQEFRNVQLHARAGGDWVLVRPCKPGAEPTVEHLELLAWIRGEYGYQRAKFDFAEENRARIREGLGEESWTWTRGVENYVGRVRLFGLDHPLGRQAYMKLITTLLGLGEAMIQVYGPPPPPGLSSGYMEKETA
jgi:hypothetical protein